MFWTKIAKDVNDLGIRAVFCCEPGTISALSFLLYVHAGEGLMMLYSTENGAQHGKIKGGMQQLSEGLARFVEQSGHGEYSNRCSNVLF